MSLCQSGFEAHLQKLADTREKKDIFHLLYAVSQASSGYAGHPYLSGYDDMGFLGLPGYPFDDQDLCTFAEATAGKYLQRPFNDFICWKASDALSHEEGDWNAVVARHCLETLAPER